MNMRQLRLQLLKKKRIFQESRTERYFNIEFEACEPDKFRMINIREALVKINFFLF